MNKTVTFVMTCFISVFVTLQLLHQKPIALSYEQGEDYHNYLPALVNSFPTLTYFQETFDGNPASPQPWDSQNWDVAVHSRDLSTWDKLEPMNAMHGEDCSPPPAAHQISAYEDAVYLCRNHLMTAINARGYGVIYLTPNHMIDFANGEAVLRFDMSTERTSHRDWINIWITPYEDNLQLPLREWLPDLNGEPRNSILIDMGVFNGQTHFGLTVYRDFQAQKVTPNIYYGYESVLTPSSMKRETFELRISRDHLKFGLPEYNLWWVDTDIPSLDWTQGVVQFGHHSYTPTKDCSGCKPNTWHWDNISFYPSVPFTIVSAEQRFASPKSGTSVDLSNPAPPNGNLRFSGIGKDIEVSFDNGKTWQKAVHQSQKRYDAGAFSSYWMPVPAGTMQVKFRGQKWWGGDWRVKDIAVWSQ